MDENIEKLIVALMVLIEEKGGEHQISGEAFQKMYGIRHKMGIKVHEFPNNAISLKLGEMTVNPDDAMMN